MSDPAAQTEPESSAKKQEEEEKEAKPFSFSYGILMIRTKKLLSVLDYLARYRIFAQMGWAFLGITLLSAAVMIWLMLDQNYLILSSNLAFRCLVGAAPASQCQAHGLPINPQPSLQSYLLLPGINPFIPVLYGLIGIIIAVVVHEGTHGVIARSVRLPVKSTGVLLLLIIPIGAFVELDEKLLQKTRFRDSGRIMAGGPGSNIIVALVALALLLVIVGGLVPVHLNGVFVSSIVAPSPADQLYHQHYLQSGDLIVAANGTRIQSVQNLSNYLSNTRPNETLILSIDHQGTINNYTITLGNNSVTGKGFIGVQSISNQDLTNIRTSYSTSLFSKPILYLIVPGIVPQAEQLVPFSNVLHGLYTSPSLGDAWYPVSLTLFWIWFINVNLAFFNAIPLYPLDGGQALLNFFSHFGKKWVEVRAKMLTTLISVIMLALILTFLFLPRILSLIPY